MARIRRADVLIALMVVVVTLMHYNTAMHIHAAHGIYRRLYYFPIIIAAFRGGRTAGLITSVAICLLYIPHAFGHIGFDPAPTLEKVLEMVLYLAVGLTTGMLADRERRARGRLQASLDERERLQGELLSRERLALLGKLSAGLAHEIRNPLASIKGAADMLTPDDADTTSPRSRMLAIIREEAIRLNDVLTRFLSFARPAGGRREACDLGQELHRLADLLRHADRPPKVTVRTPDTPVVIEAQRDQLRQLLLNLGMNAADMGHAVDLAVDTDPQHAVITITDDGPGFTDEALANLGTPFYSTRDGGTGLGLATALRMVQDHGGHLAVDPDHRPGARIQVRLPRLHGGA